MTINELSAEAEKRGCFLTIYKKRRSTDGAWGCWVQLADPDRCIQVSATEPNMNTCARKALMEWDKKVKSIVVNA